MNQRTRINYKHGITDEDALGRLGIMIFGLVVFAYIMSRLGGFVSSTSNGGTSALGVLMAFLERTGILDLFYAVRAPFIVVSVIVCAFLAAGIIYANREKAKIRAVFTHEMKLVEQKLAGEALSNKNPRWEHVLAMASSESPGEWRLAILEADTMLDELTRSMSYRGDNLGERLKNIEKSDFNTLDLAWEAHKVRNQIAHTGSDFILTSREAKRIIGLYRQVFEEFDYV